MDDITLIDDMMTAMFTTLSVIGIMVAVLTFDHWLVVIWRRVFR